MISYINNKTNRLLCKPILKSETLKDFIIEHNLKMVNRYQNEISILNKKIERIEGIEG